MAKFVIKQIMIEVIADHEDGVSYEDARDLEDIIDELELAKAVRETVKTMIESREWKYLPSVSFSVKED